MLSADQRGAVIAAARAAARTCILPRFRSLSAAEVSTKSGPADLVTVADLEAEALIVERLARDWPEAVVIGEEGVAANPALRGALQGEGPLVIVDPVDGTWNFAKGLATFGLIIAVVQGGRTIFGLLYDPLLDDWIEADEVGTFLTRTDESRRLRVSATTDPGAMLGYLPLQLFDEPTQRDLLPRFAAFSRVQTLRCSCHEYRMLAQGHADFVLSGPAPHPWDHAAGVLAATGAGGVARFLDGGAYTAARGQGVLLTASSDAAWQAVAALLPPALAGL